MVKTGILRQRSQSSVNAIRLSLPARIADDFDLICDNSRLYPLTAGFVRRKLANLDSPTGVFVRNPDVDLWDRLRRRGGSWAGPWCSRMVFVV